MKRIVFVDESNVCTALYIDGRLDRTEEFFDFDDVQDVIGADECLFRYVVVAPLKREFPDRLEELGDLQDIRSAK